MDIANSLLELVNNLWGLASRHLGYICNLKDNVRSLKEGKNDLKAVSEDVKTRVEHEEGGGAAQRTKEVENWLGKVQEFEVGVDPVLQEAGENDQIKCLSRCLPWNCRSSYRLGKRVDQMCKEASELQQKKGGFKDFTLPLPPPPPPAVLKLPMDETVGLDISLKVVWKWLVDEKQAGVLGLYGPGGVGKTTLMKRINEELSCANHGFEVVSWVVVSRQAHEDKIRDAIWKSLPNQEGNWDRWDTPHKVHHLCTVLTQRKFVLLIDDVWERLDFPNIGVPPDALQDGSKVVFTTRSVTICHQMRADKKLEVRCLKPVEALKLFEKNVGTSLVDFPREIQKLAEDIAEECKGLPLALTVVGRAMAGKFSPGSWRDALTTLRNRPHELSGMEEEVYHILEYSYYSLKDDVHRTCFLYCCLFPEDYLIRMDRLIELWIGEGLLRYTNVCDMRDEGEAILEDLKMACLLERERDDVKKRRYVKMHDVIRDMAIWIACDRGQKENKWLVIEKEDKFREMISKWGETEKASLWGEWIQNIDRTPPPCSKLKTLFIRETHVTGVPREFFHSMAACLTLLDLSDNKKIELFPEEICDLIYLQYLNLSGTYIQKLPKEIKKLTRLQCLLLENMKHDILIPTGTIPSLPLNIVSRWDSDLPWEAHCLVNEEESEEKIVEELGSMEHLTDLSIIVHEPSSTEKIFQSLNIRKCIRRVWINDIMDALTSISYSPAGGGSFSHLEVLYLTDCEVLREMEIPQEIGQAPIRSCFPNLIEVWVNNCALPNLSWLVHAPKVRKLWVSKCGSMEKIIGDGITPEKLAASGLLSNLQVLHLRSLPKLTSICDHALSFPSGASFCIEDCLGLRKFPLHSNDVRGGFKFTVEAAYDWFDQFEWDHATRVTFQQSPSRSTEEMAFGEAVRKAKDGSLGNAQIGFGPSGGSGPTE